MRRMVAASATGLFTVALLASCDSTVIEPPEDPLTEATFAAAYAEALCGFSACCAPHDLLPNAACGEEITALMQGRVDEARSAGAVFDAGNAEACLAAVTANAAACPSLKTGLTSLPRACNRVFGEKPKAAGEPCATNWECADPAIGAGEPATGACFFDYQEDQEEGYCDSVRYVGSGEPCGEPSPGEPYPVCTAPALCLLDDDDQLRCHDRFAAGEPCLYSNTTGDLCEEGSTCDPDTERCVDPIPVGESCAEREECDGHKSVDGRCSWIPEFSFEPACQPLPFGGACGN